MQYKATTRAERATSAVSAKIGSSRVVDTHQTRDRVGFALVFFGAGQRKPVRLRHAARFARVEGEVRAEDFWREDFLEGNANAECIDT